MKRFLFPNRDVTMIQGGNIVLLACIASLFAVDPAGGVEMAALVTTTVFALTLIPARLLGVKWLAKLQPDLLQIAAQGKWLGIWTCLWFMVYTSLALGAYYAGSFSPVWLVQRETVLLTASLALLVVLLSLSNKWSYAHIKYWKQINMLIWLVVPFWATHLWLAGSVFSGVEPFRVPLGILALVVIAGLSGLFRLKRDYFAFWRLWLLLLGASLSALVVWFYPAIL